MFPIVPCVMRARSVLLTILAVTAPVWTAAQAGQRSIAVAVAANMRPPFEELAARFQAQHPGIVVKAVYGASGNFFAQISNGAPFDLFISADAEFPAKLVERGLADGEAFTYAYGKLVAWVPKGSRIDLEGKGLAALIDPSVKKIAIANPAVAPYGRAAKAALQRSGVYERIRDRIVLGESVAQAAQFVESGNAQAGFLPLSLAQTPPLCDEGRAWPVPPSLHERIEQAGVVVKGARGAALARELAAFMGSGAKDVLEKYGYELPVK
jgi:molybdate transport system substrate-binding protein